MDVDTDSCAETPWGIRNTSKLTPVHAIQCSCKDLGRQRPRLVSNCCGSISTDSTLELALVICQCRPKVKGTPVELASVAAQSWQGRCRH